MMFYGYNNGGVEEKIKLLSHWGAELDTTLYIAKIASGYRVAIL